MIDAVVEPNQVDLLAQNCLEVCESVVRQLGTYVTHDIWVFLVFVRLLMVISFVVGVHHDRLEREGKWSKRFDKRLIFGNTCSIEGIPDG